MRKYLAAILILISVIGVAAIVWRAQSLRRGIFAIPEIPPGLSSPVQQPALEIPGNVPILMYHHVEDPLIKDKRYGNDITLTPALFEKQLAWLSQHGFKTVPLDYLFGKSALVAKPVVITVDDGYRDAYDTVFPLLLKYGFTATFYPIVDNIDRSGFLTPDEIREMSSAGMGFGSHTLTHPDLRNISQDKAEEEIYASKVIMERILGKKIYSLCYPGGQYDERAKNIAVNSGYADAVTTNDGTNTGAENAFELKRINVTGGTDFSRIEALK